MTDTSTRTSIVDFVADNPGVHFSELVRRRDLAPGQVQYHLRRIGDDSVVGVDLFGRTHYYPPEFDERTRRRLAVLRRETARDLVLSLLTEPAVFIEGLSRLVACVEQECRC